MTKRITILILALLICVSSVYAGDMRMTTINLSYSATKSLVPYARGITYYLMTATGNCTFNCYGGVTGDTIIFLLTSDSTAGRVMTFSTNMTANGTMTLIANQTSIIQFIYTGTTFKESYRIDGNSRPILPFSTQGDILYASATNTWSNLAKNTTATRYLSNTGTNNNPAWAQVALATGVSGTLPVANGGTGSAVGNVIADSTPDADHSIVGATIFPMVAHENVAIGDICYINADGECQIADADAEATARVFFVCADAAIAADATGNFAFIPSGFIIRDDTWNWGTKGAWVYLSTTGTTGNTWTTTAPSGTDDAVIPLGIVLTADVIVAGHLVIIEHQ